MTWYCKIHTHERSLKDLQFIIDSSQAPSIYHRLWINPATTWGHNTLIYQYIYRIIYSEYDIAFICDSERTRTVVVLSPRVVTEFTNGTKYSKYEDNTNITLYDGVRLSINDYICSHQKTPGCIICTTPRLIFTILEYVIIGVVNHDRSLEMKRTTINVDYCCRSVDSIVYCRRWSKYKWVSVSHDGGESDEVIAGGESGVGVCRGTPGVLHRWLWWIWGWHCCWPDVVVLGTMM